MVAGFVEPQTNWRRGPPGRHFRVVYDQPRVRLSRTFDADGASVLQSACKMGLEGVIAKRLNAPYRSARTDAWLKVKCQLLRGRCGFGKRSRFPVSPCKRVINLYQNHLASLS